MTPTPSPRAAGTRRVLLKSGGLLLDGRLLPLLAGGLHYFELDPTEWRAALDALRRLGLGLVDVRVPWCVHERGGAFDFGERDSRLDLRRFLREAEALGLYAIVRPGPRAGGLTGAGIPERVLWNPACQARSARGKPVVVPSAPLAFPVPSYASEAFHCELEAWLATVAQLLAPLAYPDGPLVLVEIDALSPNLVMDGICRDDHHPDAIAAYRRFLRSKYARVDRLREAHADPDLTFAAALPPAADPNALGTPQLDWAELQDATLARAVQRMRAVLESNGLDAIPFGHSVAIDTATYTERHATEPRAGEPALITLPPLHVAPASARAELVRRTTAVAARARAREMPCFAADLGAGFPAFSPPCAPDDNLSAALLALAYGLRGFSLCMAVEPDRWIGAPVDRKGRDRPAAELWRRLIAALVRNGFNELTREVAVYLVVPRSLRQAGHPLRVLPPFCSYALSQVLGHALDESCDEQLGPSGLEIAATAATLEALEAELEAQHVPFAVVEDWPFDHAVATGAWTVVLSSPKLEPELMTRLARARREGRAVSLTPFMAGPGADLLPLLGGPRVSDDERVPLVIPVEREALAASVRAAVEALGLRRPAAAPAGVRYTVHRDASAHPRVSFALNSTPVELEARVPGLGAAGAVDALSGEALVPEGEDFEVRLPPLGVRMLELRAPARADAATATKAQPCS